MATSGTVEVAVGGGGTVTNVTVSVAKGIKLEILSYYQFCFNVSFARLATLDCYRNLD